MTREHTEESLFWLWLQRAGIHNGCDSIHDLEWQQKQKADSSCLQQQAQAQSRERTARRRGFYYQPKLTPRDGFLPPARRHHLTSSNSAINWVPSIQIPETIWLFSHSDHILIIVYNKDILKKKCVAL